MRKVNNNIIGQVISQVAPDRRLSGTTDTVQILGCLALSEANNSPAYLFLQ
ncbi:MAG TPA: hypothetical protein VE089_06930 [Nitrososphaeraceae archaeon]|nr:hypothetical protein [Nitrososphaeraceae archaeon]